MIWQHIVQHARFFPILQAHYMLLIPKNIDDILCGAFQRFSVKISFYRAYIIGRTLATYIAYTLNIFLFLHPMSFTFQDQRHPPL